MFDPGLKIGETLKNSDIVEKFKCGNMGGMRRSKTTNTLVIVSDYTKGIYHDKWIGGVLHYTGMGKSGDQDINWAQNATLAACGHNGVDVHLFEVMDAGEYVYCGRIELVDKPYTEMQPGEDGIDRKVWMFLFTPLSQGMSRRWPSCRGKQIHCRLRQLKRPAALGNDRKVIKPGITLYGAVPGFLVYQNHPLDARLGKN